MNMCYVNFANLTIAILGTGRHAPVKALATDAVNVASAGAVKQPSLVDHVRPAMFLFHLLLLPVIKKQEGQSPLDSSVCRFTKHVLKSL